MFDEKKQISLASKTKLTLDVLTEEFLGRLNEYNLESRYPENYIKPPAREKVNDLWALLKTTIFSALFAFLA